MIKKGFEDLPSQLSLDKVEWGVRKPHTPEGCTGVLTHPLAFVCYPQSMLSVGIVGLPNVGKSTLFNALLAKGQALTGKYPFTTIDKNVGVVPVPDPLLEKLVDLVANEHHLKEPPRAGKAMIEFVDIAGLVRGAHQGEGLGNQFLAHIREVDLILHVVRYFADPTVAHIHEKIDPENDAALVETELLLADVASLGKQREKLEGGKRGREEEAVLALVAKILPELNAGCRARELSLSKEEKKLSKKLNLLTEKPLIYVANVAESDLKKGAKKIGTSPTLTLCAKLEEDLAKLPWTEQREFLKMYDLKEVAVETVIDRCYRALSLVTFYTLAGGKEVRAWPVPKGTLATQAAGKVHRDFERGFISAEVIPVAELLPLGSYHQAREAGQLRLEGRDYVIRDGDVVEFRFSV